MSHDPQTGPALPELAASHTARARAYLTKATQELEQHKDPRTERTIAVDFDGVIHSYRGGYKDGTIYDEPMPGAFEGLKRLMRFACVYILSTRSPSQIAEWMAAKCDIPCVALPSGAVQWRKPGVIGVTNEKLLCTHIVDDRAVRFTNWTDIANLLG